ncbi:MAG TPA: hypothetical protein VF615_19530 [Longimicrobiaceae bacterium]|jgi:hypothetical protein
MRPSLLLPALALLPAALAAQQPAPNAPRSLAGCWALTPGPWTPALAASAAHTLPSRIALDTVAAEETTLRGSLRVRAVGGTAGTARHVASWSPLPFRRDSLRIRWSTVGAGVDARLRVVRSGELRGRATAFTVDAPGGAATATLVARRVADCAAPPPPVAAAPPAAAPAAAEGVTVVPGLEARGTRRGRDPDTRPERPRTPPVAEPEGLPRPPAPPIGRAEEVAGYVVGGAILWLLVHLAGVL